DARPRPMRRRSITRPLMSLRPGWFRPSSPTAACTVHRTTSPMRHILAIDAGTTGVTCLMVGEDGRVVSRGYREVTQFFPKPGWVEHDPDQIFDATLGAAREAIAGAKSTPAAIGIT